MNEVYLRELEELLRQTRPRLASKVELEYKNVFGAVAGYANGNIFIVCGKFGIALKLPSNTLEKLFEAGKARPFKYFPKGHIKKEYAYFPKRVTHDREQFRKLLDKSIKFVDAF